MSSTPTEAVDDSQLFSELVSALAVGARAVSNLPLEDEFDYQSSFPEFRQLLSESKEGLLDALIMALEDSASETKLSAASALGETHLDDPLLWEICADACDALLEQVESHLREDISSSANLSRLSDTARRQAQSSFGRLLEGLVEMEKPQLTHRLYDGTDSNRFDRQTPFIPKIKEKPHSVTPLDLTLQPGHGLSTRFGPLWSAKNVAIAPNVVAPSFHVPHVYEKEIRSFQYLDDQLEAPSFKPAAIEAVENLQATWVDTPEALLELGALMSQNLNLSEIALDLEAHSYRSFAGLTCLIQLSFKSDSREPSGGETHNFLIDPFPLWNVLSRTLGPFLTNPSIVKVLHGADSDIQWLQRDFGLYIVNLFDTGRAARALQLPSASYAYLLKHYVGITADKTHQLSDWRQRPLPDSMKQYAIMDTHYLLDIYHHLKYDLGRKRESNLLKDVWDTSRQVSLIRYAPEPFRPDGYKSLISSSVQGRMKRTGAIRGHKTELNQTQESVMRALYDWRDRTARTYDESITYVCSNQALVRLSLSCPTNLASLQALLNPMPPLILRLAKEVLGIIQRATHQNEPSADVLATPKSKPSLPVGAPSSAFFKPAKSQMDEPSLSIRAEERLLSPVLGTEALYMQAGWITPQHEDDSHRGPDAVDDIANTTTDDDDGDDHGDGTMQESRKPRHGLSIHEANQKYRSNRFAPHSLQLGSNDDERGGSLLHSGMRGNIDGMGTARAAREHSRSPIETRSIEEDAELAQKNASHIRNAMSREEQQLLGLISSGAGLDDDDDDRDGVEEGGVPGAGRDGKSRENDEDDFVIPRSMREIYRISNRNRRNKKASSPAPNERGTPINEKELEALAQAEAVLKARGLEGRNYFDEFPDSPKRQRTKSTGTASTSSEEGQGHDSGTISREDDIALMQEIGWIKGKEEVESMLKHGNPPGEGDDGAADAQNESEDDESSKPSKPTFDYASVGAIGAFNPAGPTSSNPFFAGAATAGGHLTQLGKTDRKKQNSGGRGKQSRRQVERPEKRDGRAQAYKKR